MVHTYSEWLNESGRDLKSPISIEIEAGKIKVYADPQAENWIGETVRSQMYEDLQEDLRDALKDEDDPSLKSILKDLRDTPLFSNDQSNVWRQSQIDGVEQFRTGAEYRRWLAKYCINKINAFLKWARNN
jgi:hypothetical protein